MQKEQQAEKKIILVGNPNVGKSVVFNSLTGSYTTVSNYPGTSVEVSRGHCQIGNENFLVLDTPGMYSLLPITEEERVARRILLEESPHVILHVIDARNLERMLPMTLQLIEAGLPVVVLVNIMDEAERIGMKIDIPLLQEKLQVPVVGGAIGRGKRGLLEVREAIGKYQAGKATFTYATDLEKDIQKISALLQGDYILARRSLTLMLLQRDDEIAQRVRDREGDRYASVENAVNDTIFARRVDLHLRISLERKRICKGLLDGVVSQQAGQQPAFIDRFSAWTMNPWTGIPLLLLVLYFGLYQFVGGFRRGHHSGFPGRHGFRGISQPVGHRLVRKVYPLVLAQRAPGG